VARPVPHGPRHRCLASRIDESTNAAKYWDPNGGDVARHVTLTGALMEVTCI
jgi:hypothetical protein